MTQESDMNPNQPEPTDQTPATETPVTPAGPTPANPFEQTTPATTSSTGGVTPGQKKPVNKKLIAIIGGAVGVILLAIVGVAVFLALTTVSKEDYRAATLQYNEVSRSSSALTREVSSLSSGLSRSTDAEFAASAKEVEEALATLRDENKKLGGEKAVTVGEGKELYTTFNTKLSAYTAYADELMTSVKSLRPAMVVCEKISDEKDNAGRVTALKACSTALGDVKDLPNAEFKTFVGVLQKSYSDYATAFEKTAALTAPFGAQNAEYRALRDQATEAQKNITTASREFSSALGERDKEMSVKESADALAKYLTEQQRK